MTTYAVIGASRGIGLEYVRQLVWPYFVTILLVGLSDALHRLRDPRRKSSPWYGTLTHPLI